MKILVTGGSGFIGSHLVERYQGRAEVIVLDNLRSGRRGNLDGLECRFVEGSILDAKLVRELAEGVDQIFHLAAMVSVPESMEDPLETVSINITGLLNVLEAARAARVGRFVFASSAAVYGENTPQPAVETAVPDPRSPYAITKLDGEYYCSLFAREGWVSTACLRFFNVFGPRQDPASPYAAAVPIFAARALAGKPLTVYGDGGQTRDFISVKDIAGALDFIAGSGETGVFNAGYGSSITVLELANRILALAGSGSAIEHAPVRAGDIRHSTSDPGKLFRSGWVPEHGLEEALGETVAAMREAAGRAG